MFFFLSLLTLTAAYNFGPVFKYENGEYYGQNYLHEAHGLKVPHGLGTYVSDDKSVKFNGVWKHGEPHNGTRFYSVRV